MTSIVGAVNATTIFLGALYALNVLPVVSVERAVFYRERSAFFYHSLPFSLAQCTVELPYIFAQACVYSCIVYWCCGLELDAGECCIATAHGELKRMHCLTPGDQLETYTSSGMLLTPNNSCQYAHKMGHSPSNTSR